MLNAKTCLIIDRLKFKMQIDLFQNKKTKLVNNINLSNHSRLIKFDPIIKPQYINSSILNFFEIKPNIFTVYSLTDNSCIDYDFGTNFFPLICTDNFTNKSSCYIFTTNGEIIHYTDEGFELKPWKYTNYTKADCFNNILYLANDKEVKIFTDSKPKSINISRGSPIISFIAMEYFICVLYQNSEIVFYDTKKDSIFRSQFLNHIPIKSASLTLIDDGFVLISIDSNLYFLDSYSPGYYCTLDLHDSKFISAYGTHEHIYVIESKEQVKYFCVYNYQLINSLGKVELENVNETSKIFIESSHKLFIYDDTKFISYFFQENKTNEIEKTIEKVFEDFDVNINEDLKTNIRKVTYKITENDILNESVILNIINSLQINKNNETKVVKSLYIEHILFKDYITQSFKQIFTLLTIFNVFPMDKMTIKYKASINTLSLIYYTMYKFVNSEIYLKVKMIPFNSFESFREQISYFLYDSKFLHSLEPIDCIIFSSIFEDFMFPIRYLDLAIAYLNINDINSFFKTIHKTNLKNIPKNIILNIINILLKNQNYEQCEWIINNSFDNNEKIENEFLIPLMQCYISNAKFDMAVALLMERIKDKESVTEEIVNCLNGLIEALEINTMTQILIMYPFNEFQRNFVCEIFEKDGKEDISRTITQTLKKN